MQLLVSANPAVHHIETNRRVFPESRSSSPTTSKLSVIDATVARFSPTAAIWLHDKPKVIQTLPSNICSTISHALNDIIPRHLGRPVVVHGTLDDPGVELVVVNYDMNLDCVVPSRDERAARLTEWDASGFPQSDFLPPTKIALMSLNAIKDPHPLADAITLMNFMHLWAARSRMILSKDAEPSELKVLEPVFNPSLLDQVAGLRHGRPPDLEKISKARLLAMHPSTDELSRTELSPSTLPPWKTWDMGAAVTHAQIRFSADELARMKDAARASLLGNLKSLRVSRLGAMPGHIWTLISRARGYQGHRGSVYMDITLGLRNRVSPPLPGNFVGSPMLLGYVEKAGDQAASEDLGSAAGSIRHMMSRFMPDAVAAYIHDAAHEVSPQRLWQAFVGSQHTLVTSWVGAKTYEVDFLGTGDLARHVQGVMPNIDGLVQVMEIANTGDFDV
ncbi:transferase [Colletotrichum somersetense]|nr:transferase [Colletotrichum somersetense]